MPGQITAAVTKGEMKSRRAVITSSYAPVRTHTSQTPQLRVGCLHGLGNAPQARQPGCSPFHEHNVVQHQLASFRLLDVQQQTYTLGRPPWHAKIGVQHCPNCDLRITSQTAEQILAHLMSTYQGQQVTFLAPLTIDLKPDRTLFRLAHFAPVAG